MTRPCKAGALLLAVALATSGCLVLPKDISSSTRPLEPGTFTEVADVTGSAWNFFAVALFVPFGGGPSDPAAVARDDAMQKAGGADALVNVAVDQWIIPIPLPLVSITFYRTAVHGTAVRMNDMASTSAEDDTLLSDISK